MWDSICVTAVGVCRVNIMDGDAIAGQICVSGRVDEMAESYRRVLEDPTPAVRGWPACVEGVVGWNVGSIDTTPWSPLTTGVAHCTPGTRAPRQDDVLGAEAVRVPWQQHTGVLPCSD